MYRPGVEAVDVTVDVEEVTVGTLVDAGGA